MTQRNYLVRNRDLQPYHPANHTGTTNYRIIGPETVGKTGVEMLLGVIERGQGAIPHAHPGIEQVCYLLSGSAVATIDGQTLELGAGDACYFPADTMHTFTVTSHEPARVLVIYTPPYGEDPKKTYTAAAQR